MIKLVYVALRLHPGRGFTSSTLRCDAPRAGNRPQWTVWHDDPSGRPGA
jgi:hypothetical protein